MKKYKIKFSKDARNDLVDIYKYISNNLQEPNIAKKLIQKMRKEIYELENSPQIYSIINDNFLKKLEIRKIRVKNYFVFYSVNVKDRSVEVIRIMYARRNWSELI